MQRACTYSFGEGLAVGAFLRQGFSFLLGGSCSRVDDCGRTPDHEVVIPHGEALVQHTVEARLEFREHRVSVIVQFVVEPRELLSAAPCEHGDERMVERSLDSRQDVEGVRIGRPPAVDRRRSVIDGPTDERRVERERRERIADQADGCAVPVHGRDQADAGLPLPHCCLEVVDHRRIPSPRL